MSTLFSVGDLVQLDGRAHVIMTCAAHVMPNFLIASDAGGEPIFFDVSPGSLAIVLEIRQSVSCGKNNEIRIVTETGSTGWIHARYLLQTSVK